MFTLYKLFYTFKIMFIPCKLQIWFIEYSNKISEAFYSQEYPIMGFTMFIYIHFQLLSIRK